MDNLNNHPQSALLKQFMKFYENFSSDNITELESLYTQDVEFKDPVHVINGILPLKSYFRKMAENLLHYEVRYVDFSESNNSAYFTWEISYAHKKLRSGKLLTIRGMSRIRYTNRIFYHEDCYDMGAMIYEHVPIIGSLTAFLKNRLAAF